MSRDDAPNTVIAAFHALARQFPGRAAVVWGAAPISYETLFETSVRLSHALIEDGVRAGDRVALILDNSPDFIVAYLAIIGAGAVAVPLNPRAPVAAHARVFEDCRPVAGFFQSSSPEAALTLGSSAPDFKMAYSAN
jgi:acyl-CoA synthetase (AMP-forming)/AMP-acid ligase II